MKRYKLLKDLPTFKAGEEFFISKSGNLIAGTPSNPKQITVETQIWSSNENRFNGLCSETLEEFPNILTDWFEEVKEPEEYFIINFLHLKITKISTDFFAEWVIENLKSLGLLFETREEAEKYLEYLKAKTIIKQDAKGFKPNWQDTDEDKWCGVWDIIYKEVSTHITWYGQEDIIYFKSKEDVEESFEKHPDEWKTYLTYEG